MINYPNGKKHIANSFSNTSKRGMGLEDDINITNSYYLECDVANIHKKPTPVQIVNVDYPCRASAKITEAYFKIPSTTDYNGVYRSCALDFEAKETQSRTSFPLSSIHHHQIKHLASVLRHGAIAFIIVRFTHYEETYYVQAEKLLPYIDSLQRKSIPYQWFKDNGIIIPYNYAKPVDYLKVIDYLYFDKGDNL